MYSLKFKRVLLFFMLGNTLLFSAALSGKKFDVKTGVIEYENENILERPISKRYCFGGMVKKCQEDISGHICDIRKGKEQNKVLYEIDKKISLLEPKMKCIRSAQTLSDLSSCMKQSR